jgi:hypothetical protein
MASNYSDLKIELIGTGEQAGTWGNTTNINLGTALQEAITGSADVAFSSGDVTLTLSNSNGAQVGRNLRLNLTGTSGGARELILGAEMQVEKLYLINNTLLDAVTVKNTTGTGIAVPAGKTMFVFNNGTNVVDAVTHLTSLTLGAALPVASGGTGVTSSTGTGSVVLSDTPTLTTVNATTFDTNVAAAGVTLAGTTLAADGTDANISLTMTPKGTGELVTASFMSGIFSDKLSALGNLGATATLTNSNGTVFTATLDQSCTLTVSGSNQVASRSSSFTLILTRGSGGPFTLTLAGGTFLAADGSLSPTTTDSTTDIWFFFTVDGGSNWYVSIPIKNASSI